MARLGTVAVVYGVPAGVGGLGVQSGNAIADWAAVAERVLAVGPGRADGFHPPGRVEWVAANANLPAVFTRYTWLRWFHGRRQLLTDRRTGTRAAAALASTRPDLMYTFTQVGLEPLTWAERAGVPAVLESPNGHIRNFREVYLRETARFGGGAYLGHPSPGMVARVEREYTLAGVIRVSSEWAKACLVAGGVPAGRVMVIGQRPTAPGYEPVRERLPPTGPFRVCFVGSLDLRKGFAHLLRAARRFGPDRVSLRMVGGTVDRFTRRLLESERQGLAVEVAPGDPRAALRWAELFVLPTLEDGSPFALVEALAAGVPAVVTDACGNHPIVRPGETGWVVPAGDESALASALASAWERRAELPAMGAAARATWEQINVTHTGDALLRLADLATAARKGGAA